MTLTEILRSYVEERGRRFVRHYVIDFGATLGSFSTRPKGVHEGAEHILEVGRTLGEIASLGLYRRPFEEDRSEWEAAVAELPSELKNRISHRAQALERIRAPLTRALSELR